MPASRGGQGQQRTASRATGTSICDYETFWGSISGRSRRYLEDAPTKKLHLCRESPCWDLGDYALHRATYSPIDADDLASQQLGSVARGAYRFLGAAGWLLGVCGCRCLACGCGCAGRQGARCFRRLCSSRRQWPPPPPELTAHGDFSEPEERKCCADQILDDCDGQVQQLAPGKCPDKSSRDAVPLLAENADLSSIREPPKAPDARFCHGNACRYRATRLQKLCSRVGCPRHGDVVANGTRYCVDHAAAALGQAQGPPMPPPAEPTPGLGARGQRLGAGASPQGAAAWDLRPPSSDIHPLAAEQGINYLALLASVDDETIYHAFRAAPVAARRSPGWDSWRIAALDWNVEVPREVSPLTGSRLAAEARAAGAPLLIAPTNADRVPQGVAADGHSMGLAGITHLQMQRRLGRLEHASASATVEAPADDEAVEDGGHSEPLGEPAPPGPSADRALGGTPQSGSSGPGARRPAERGEPPSTDGRIDLLRDRQPEPEVLDRDALRAILTDE
ncbi:unnamed protein product, partial [Prorocentrum cordatum]